MASYLEIKQLLKEIFCIDYDIDENCDVYIPNSFNSSGGTKIVLNNSDLKNAFNNMQNYNKEKLAIATENYREVALQNLGMNARVFNEVEQISDSVNGLIYTIGYATTEYCMFLLDAIVESVKVNGRRLYIDLRHRGRLALERIVNIEEGANNLIILPKFLRAYTLKIHSTKAVPISRLRECASSYEFVYMYKRSLAISEYKDVNDMFSFGNSMFRFSREDMDSPPLRIYNAEVLDYYTMAMESRDPFTMYISFYHVIEHYFDAVFRRKLTDSIKEKITHIDFSYKSETKLYELAKYIKKHMSSDDDSGKGNEFDSLKYVLMEFVPIDELIKRIDVLNTSAVDYYQNSFVPFTTSKKTKIAWSDSKGVYTNLTTRIYETRNALVHSKSEQLSNQYRPYENKKDLVLEIPLIKAVAELVLINSSEMM